LTFLLVDPDQASQRQTIAALSERGHRAVPVSPEEAPDLIQRLRFHAVFWAARANSSRLTDLQERVRSLTPCFVLMGDAYDRELADSIEQGGGFLLVRPLKDAELERVLSAVEQRAASASAGR
jgi:DNA-binding response OmpR family regulator